MAHSSSTNFKDPNKTDLETIKMDVELQKTVSISDGHIGSPASSEVTFAPEVEKSRLKQIMILQELLETERGYVNDISLLVRCYLDPLNHIYLASVATSGNKVESAADIVQNTKFGNENTSGWINFDQKQTIIRNSAALLRVQKLLLKMMEEALAPITMSAQENGKALSNLTTMFNNMMAKIESVYLPYCSQHDMAIEVLSQIRKTHPNQLQQFLDEQRQQSNSRLDIQDFLIKPVQRICKYPLLLQELAKTMKEEGGELYLNFQQCLNQMKDLVSRINEKKKIIENERKRDLLLQRITGNSATQLQQIAAFYDIKLPDICSSEKKQALGVQSQAILGQKMQTMIRGSGLAVLTPTDLEKQQQDIGLHRGVFLFHDVMFIVYPKKVNTYQLLSFILVQDIELIEELDAKTAINPSPADDAFHFAWKVLFKKIQNGILFSKTEVLAYQFGAKSEKDRNAWLTELEALVPGKVKRIMNENKMEDASTIASPLSTNNEATGSRRPGKSALASSRQSEDDASQNLDGLPDIAAKMRNLNAQLQIDIKLNDVYTVDHSTMNKGILSARTNTVSETVTSLSRVSSIHRPTTAVVSHSAPLVDSPARNAASLDNTPTLSPVEGAEKLPKNLQRSLTEFRSETVLESKNTDGNLRRTNSIIGRLNISRVLSKSNASLAEDSSQQSPQQVVGSATNLSNDEKRRTISKSKLFRAFSKTKNYDSDSNLGSKSRISNQLNTASIDIDQALALAGDEEKINDVAPLPAVENHSKDIILSSIQKRMDESEPPRKNDETRQEVLPDSQHGSLPDPQPLSKTRIESASSVHDIGFEAFIAEDNQIRLHNTKQMAATTASPLRHTASPDELISQTFTDKLSFASRPNRENSSLISTHSVGSHSSFLSKSDVDSSPSTVPKMPIHATDKSLKEVVENLIVDVKNADLSLREVVDTFVLKSSNGILTSMNDFDTNLTINTADLKLLPRPPSNSNASLSSIRHSVFRLKKKNARFSTESSPGELQDEMTSISPDDSPVIDTQSSRDISRVLIASLSPTPPQSPQPTSSLPSSYRRRRLSRQSFDENGSNNNNETKKIPNVPITLLE